MRNLVALGIDPAPDPQRLLLRGERPEWNNSNKSLRRAFIAANYRIVALVGDDLGDFVDPQVFAGDRERLEPRFGDDLVPAAESHLRLLDQALTTRSRRNTPALRTGDVVLELPGGGPWQGKETRVRIASWNVEYLMTPATHLRAAQQLRGERRHGGRRRPHAALCHHQARTAQRRATTPRCATTPRQLRADIVALQEVDGPEAAAQVFPGYDFCFSTRAHTQKNGFAIRRGLPHRCEPEYEPLSLDNAVRRGVVVTFFPGTANEFRLMSVHLKSGCPAGPLTAAGRNCELLSRQVAPLEAWIEE